MKVALASCLLALGVSFSSDASTILQVTHSGATDPRTEGFSGPSPTSTNVTSQGVNIAGTDAWSITDPGILPGGKSNSNNYAKTFSDADLVALLQNGWSMTARVSVPDDTPTMGVAWAADSQAWVGAYYKHASTVEGLATATQRIAFGLMLGRDDQGNTIAGLYASGVANLVLDPGFHTYEWHYNPTSKKVSVLVDGDFWTDYAGTVSTTTTFNQFYWGDNNAQTVATNLPRSAYYAYVHYSIAPEPSMAVLASLGLASLLLRRRRL